MDPELPAPTSSHFPFILDHHTQRHQERGEYHSHEARDREWTAAQRTVKDYERGFLREAWQRRWEPCGPARYNREVSTKRNDSSYRELEAWAARYCHSLPRRRRLEAELRGASQGLQESSRAAERDGRTGSDPRAAALQQLRQSANIGESGVWDSGGRMQTPTYYQLQAASPDTSRTLDIKEKTGTQRRMFSQPPGYTAPPPYNSPHKCTPSANHCDTGWEQQGKRQTYWPQAPLRKDASEGLQYKSKEEKEDFTKSDQGKICAELGGIKHRRQGTEAIQATTMQHEDTLSLRQTQTVKAFQNTNKQTSSKIIEGRKFRLNKKTGGMTVFCLVSRIAGVTETPSLPLRIQQTNTEELSRDSNDNQTNLADEVDFNVSQKSNTDVTNIRQSETQAHAEREMLKDNLSKTEETGNVSPEGKNLTDASSTIGTESKQPVSVKYPLWREPAFTSRPEAGASSTSCLKVQGEDGRSDGPLSQEQCGPKVPEARTPDMKKNQDSEGSKGLWVIDTSCVVVKMELIPSPKKEHVHYVANQAETESTNPVTTTNKATDPHSDPAEQRASSQGDISSLCMSTASGSETWEERAQRILGIPLYDCISEQQSGEQPDEEAEPVTTEEEEPQAGQTEDAVCLNSEEAEDQPCRMSEENDTDFQLETDLSKWEEPKMTEGDRLESSGKPEGDQHFSPPEDLCDSSGLTHSTLTVLSDLSDSNDDDSELAALVEAETPTFPHTRLDLASPLPRGSTESSPSPDHSPSLRPPLHLINESLEATPTITPSKNEEEPLQLVEIEFNSSLQEKDLAEQTSEQPGYERPEDPACAEESNTAAEQQSQELEPKHTMEETCEISNENTQSHMSEEETTVFLEMKPEQDDRTESRSDRENEEEQDESCVKERHDTEAQTGAADANMTEPSGLDCDVLSPSELPPAEPVSLNPDPTVPQSLPAPDLDQINKLPSSFLPDSPSNLPFSFTPSQQDDESVFLDSPQYPTTLWDAVNRIRKHTAPDSENEEEEVSDLWDPESLGEGPGCSDEVEESRKMGFIVAEQQEASSEGSVEDVDMGQIQQHECHEEPGGHTEEDTLSCSSHSSGDTVIVAEEDKVQGTTLDAGAEGTRNKQLHAAEGTTRCCEDETVDEEDEEEQLYGRDTNV